MPNANLLFISWAPHCSRSDSIAARMGGRSFMIYAGWLGSNYLTVPIKYVIQAVHTLWVLLKHRPRSVCVMAPPVLACFPVWLYCLLFRARFAIDAHTGAFLIPRWERLQFLQKFFSRRAATTIVTNDYLKQLVEKWDAHATIIPDVPVSFATPKMVDLGPGCHMTLVASFCADEPIAEAMEAAGHCSETTIHVTGNHRRLDQFDVGEIPANVRFLGFLSDEEYVGQLLASDAVIALTTRDHTMQRAAYEAIYLERPVITSRFGVLLKAFPQATVHVVPDTDGIAAGIQEMSSNISRFKEESVVLKQRKLTAWELNAASLRSILEPNNRHDSLG